MMINETETLEKVGGNGGRSYVGDRAGVQRKQNKNRRAKYAKTGEENDAGKFSSK